LRGTAKELPTAFDWRAELAGISPPGTDTLGAHIDQGACGSCYAFAGVMVMQMRLRVQLFKQHGILYPVELSWKTPTRCSMYTEGCNGGFSYFTYRLASEIGIPLFECDRSVSAAGLDETCDWKCYQNNSMLFFAKDYWHVGGFSHGSSEASIMEEVHKNGPVEVGFSTSAFPEFIYASGRSFINETDAMILVNNSKAPKEPFSTNDKIHRWWWATHAIIIVGWGEEQAWGQTSKYWIVRNSWGRGWGHDGYAYMKRGNNDGGIETDASFVVPDMDRLPPGFLEKAQKFHADKAQDRATWKAEKSGLTGSADDSKIPGGIPDYCKDRPDSIDCQ
jgi:cathepsin C